MTLLLWLIPAHYRSTYCWHRGRLVDTVGAVSRHLGLKSQPNDYLASGEEWPDGKLVDDAPPEAYLARSVSSRFRRLLGYEDWNQKQASEQLDISTHTVNDLFHGKTWPSFAVIARIEHRLSATLLHGAYELTDEPAEAYQQPPTVPNSYLVAGERWPYGDLVDDAPAEARLAQAIAKNVDGALRPRGLTPETASKDFGLSPHTIRDICDGEIWASYAAVARIEDRLGFPLWARSRRMAADTH